jgi:hypothetical protein
MIGPKRPIALPGSGRGDAIGLFPFSGGVWAKTLPGLARAFACVDSAQGRPTHEPRQWLTPVAATSHRRAMLFRHTGKLAAPTEIEASCRQ